MNNLKSQNGSSNKEKMKKVIGLSRLRDRKVYIENRRGEHKGWINNFILFIIGLTISIVSSQLRWLGLIIIIYAFLMIVESFIRRYSYKKVLEKVEGYFNKIEKNSEIPDDINDFVDDLTEEIKQIKIEKLRRKGLKKGTKEILFEEE